MLRNDPKKYLTYRKTIESELNSRFKFIINGSKEQADARAVGLRSHIPPIYILIISCSSPRKR